MKCTRPEINISVEESTWMNGPHYWPLMPKCWLDGFLSKNQGCKKSWVDCYFCPGGGTPYVMGDTYVPRFWPSFFTLAGSSTIFWGCFFSSTNTKTIFWVQILAKFDLFGPKIPFFPRSFWVQFSVARGTPPAIFGPSTPPGYFCLNLSSN